MVFWCWCVVVLLLQVLHRCYTGAQPPHTPFPHAQLGNGVVVLARVHRVQQLCAHMYAESLHLSGTI